MKKILLLATLLVTFLFTTLNVSAIEIKTATFNIRMATPVDSANEWKYRLGLVMDMLTIEQFDVIGFQEVLQRQLEDLGKMMPNYAYVGVGREDFGQKGEYAPIFYRADKYRKIESNTFVLAEDTLFIGKLGWDAACTRIVTWVLLEDIKTKQRFYFFNTHFDHVGIVAQKYSAQLLSDKAVAKNKKHSVIITGDFNVTPDSEPYTILTKNFQDSKKIALKVTGESFSYQGFKKIPEEKYSLIDFIFVSKEIKVKEYYTIFTEKDGVSISDHNVVVAVVEIK
jgi:endonuclease/exonuclease/phosphatase family metal-dependent hydrolase